jgi:hypothetical protein
MTHLDSSGCDLLTVTNQRQIHQANRMKTYLPRILLLASMSSLFAMSGYAGTIDSLPYTIKKPGTYTLAGNLSFSGTTNAITVTASNVVLDLNGHTLTGTNGYAIFGSGVSNVTVQNGTINGFFAGIEFESGSEELLQNLRISNASAACIELTTCTSGTIQNCFILGDSSPGVDGVYLGGCQGIVVKNNQIANIGVGCDSNDSSGNIFIADQLTNCLYGLYLGALDKYQGNVTAACTTPFSGGIAVGYENN